MSLDQAIVGEIAAELGINPAFVEKDWYSVQALKLISQHHSEDITTIFSGGTSLSKGHRLIQRFSEDLDFRCRYNAANSGNKSKLIRRTYRESIIDQLSNASSLALSEDAVTRAGNYFKFPLTYPQAYEEHSALRPNLEVEFSFTQPQLEPQTKPIQSLMAQFAGGEPEAYILCLSPIEIAADKLSALTWRVLKRDRMSSKDDPTIIRHLHDLCALIPAINANFSVFEEAARASFEVDQKSTSRQTSEGFHGSVARAFETLMNDGTYKAEYRQFVDAMSYANDEDNIDFDRALKGFKNLTEQLR